MDALVNKARRDKEPLDCNIIFLARCEPIESATITP